MLGKPRETRIAVAAESSVTAARGMATVTAMKSVPTLWYVVKTTVLGGMMTTAAENLKKVNPATKMVIAKNPSYVTQEISVK